MNTSHGGSETKLFIVVIPLLSRFLSPLNMLIGGTVVVLVFLGFVWMSHNKDILRKLKKQYPTTFVVAIMLSSYFLISYLGDVMVFMFGITLPLLCKYFFSSLGGVEVYDLRFLKQVCRVLSRLLTLLSVFKWSQNKTGGGHTKEHKPSLMLLLNEYLWLLKQSLIHHHLPVLPRCWDVS